MSNFFFFCGAVLSEQQEGELPAISGHFKTEPNGIRTKV